MGEDKNKMQWRLSYCVTGHSGGMVRQSPVSVVDVWMDYKRLAEAGWTQQRIAGAKGVDQAQVARRLQYANMPQSMILFFMKNEFLKEGHLAEVYKLCNFHNLTPMQVMDSFTKKRFPKGIPRRRN